MWVSKFMKLIGQQTNSTERHLQETLQDFPGGTVAKNPPANAGVMGSSPGLGRSHMPWSN